MLLKTPSFRFRPLRLTPSYIYCIEVKLRDFDVPSADVNLEITITFQLSIYIRLYKTNELLEVFCNSNVTEFLSHE